MFAVHDRSEIKSSTETKSPAVSEKPVGQPARKESKSVWQSLALNPATIQAKLDISQPGDPSEQEADRIADQVLRMPESDTVTPEPSTRLEILRGGGQPLPGPTRAFFEPRFARDLSDVRVHTDAGASELAQGVNAKAFTIGHDIVFGAGQFAPTATEGKRLLGHELTHVVQQSPADRQQPAEGAAGAPVMQANPDATLQRQPAGPEASEEIPPVATGPSIHYVAGVEDLKVADAAVRDFFGSLIKGPRVQPSQFKVVEEEKFGKAIPNAKEAIPRLLLSMFLNPDSEVVHNILRFHGVGASLGPDPTKRLTSFIKERITAGFFAYTDATSVVRLTPEELVASETKGVTTDSKQRSRRQIVVQPGQMSTVVHEVMHFYTHPTYQTEVAKQAEVAKKTGKTHFTGMLLSEVLIEGVTEHLTRKVMSAREEQLGQLGSAAYASYVEAVELLAEVTGEHTLRLAYLQGDKQAIARLFKNIDIFNRLLAEGDFSADKIVEIHHLHEPLAASWFQ